MAKAFEKKLKGDKPIIALCYDFDKTLTPTDMQAQGFIQNVAQMDVRKFWEESNGLAKDNDMDQNLAWMYKMVEESIGKVYLNKKAFLNFGSNIELFNGVDSWFDRINEYGKTKGVDIEHYIISSGLKEMIEGTIIADKFEKIYASSFYYDEKGLPKWPAQVVNYTNKTQFLFRIEKGILDINDLSVNDYIPEEDLRIPFRNMIYIGDSDTDVPCMKLVNTRGGHSIGVYADDKKDKVYNMLAQNRIKYFVKADYSDDSELDLLVKNIIDKTIAAEKLQETYFNCKKEYKEYVEKTDENEIKKNHLINKLESSSNFIQTHSIIAEMDSIKDWKEEQVDRILDIAISNFQVTYILRDGDIKDFFTRISNEYAKTKNKCKELYENHI